MLRILQVIGSNLRRAPATVRLPDTVPTPAGFHGRVVLDPKRCVACGVCAYVCVSDAVTGANEEDAYAWSYDPARCAFCARCVDHCAGRALTMAEAPSPAYARPGELAVTTKVPFPPCPDCGAPARPATDELLALAFHRVEEGTLELVRRCERCKRRHLQRSLAAASGVEAALGAAGQSRKEGER